LGRNETSSAGGGYDPLALPALTPFQLGTVAAEQTIAGRDYAHSTAVLEASSDSETVMRHYAREVEKAGWDQVEKGHDALVAWSTWSFVDAGGRQGKGILFVLLQSPPSQFLLFVRASVEKRV
jgi:hypothetical protein